MISIIVAVIAAIPPTLAVIVAIRRNTREHDANANRLDDIAEMAQDTRDTVHRVEGHVEQLDGRVTRLEDRRHRIVS